MLRNYTLITTAALLALFNFVQVLSFQIAGKRTHVTCFDVSANHVMPLQGGNQHADTFLLYKNKEFEDDAEDTNSAVETKDIDAEAPPKKKSRVVNRVASSSKKHTHTVISLDEYREKMKENKDRLIVIRFFSHWCKSCKAVTPKFHRLARKNPQVTFIDIPITNDNKDLAKELNIKAVPFGHIIDPNAGLVEELRMSKMHWNEFEKTLYTYTNGSCDISTFEYENPYGNPRGHDVSI